MNDYTIEKGRDGWEAKTVIPMPGITTWGNRGTTARPGEARLTIRTDKGYKGGIQSRASVSHHGEGFQTHAFGLGSPDGGDYSKIVGQWPSKATEKAVRLAHEAAIREAAAIEADARAFYAAQDEREKAKAMVQAERERGAAPAIETNQTVREITGNA